MKKLLLILGMFSFLTVFAVSSSTVKWSGIVLTSNGDLASEISIHCLETRSIVQTDYEGRFENLILLSRKPNTLIYNSIHSGQNLGTQIVQGSYSNMSDQILQIQR